MFLAGGTTGLVRVGGSTSNGHCKNSETLSFKPYTSLAPAILHEVDLPSTPFVTAAARRFPWRPQSSARSPVTRSRTRRAMPLPRRRSLGAQPTSSSRTRRCRRPRSSATSWGPSSSPPACSLSWGQQVRPSPGLSWSRRVLSFVQCHAPGLAGGHEGFFMNPLAVSEGSTINEVFSRCSRQRWSGDILDYFILDKFQHLGNRTA